MPASYVSVASADSRQCAGIHHATGAPRPEVSAFGHCVVGPNPGLDSIKLIDRPHMATQFPRWESRWGWYDLKLLGHLRQPGTSPTHTPSWRMLALVPLHRSLDRVAHVGNPTPAKVGSGA